MQLIGLDNSAWFTTFPHRVAPLQEEWFPGLLLRCDEANYWESKKTLASALFPFRQYRTDPPFFIVSPYILDLEYLAEALAVSMHDLLATTYHVELSRLYGVSEPREWYLYPNMLFHLCPECLAQKRLLQRFLALPHITICPRHHLVLAETCLCGTSLQLFNRQAQPFTCYWCSLDWAKLPRVKPSTEQVPLEQKYLACYDFFFSHGSRKVLQYTHALIYEKRSPPLGASLGPQETWSQRLDRADRVIQKPKMSLGALVYLLIRFRLSPSDILSRMPRSVLLEIYQEEEIDAIRSYL